MQNTFFIQIIAINIGKKLDYSNFNVQLCSPKRIRFSNIVYKIQENVSKERFTIRLKSL